MREKVKSGKWNLVRPAARPCRRARGVGAAALAALVFAGCFAGFERPEVRLHGVRVGGIGLRGGTVYARLQVVNPNGFTLRADELTYDLEFAGERVDEWLPFAEGVFEERIEVPGRDSATVEIPVEFTYRELGQAMQSVLDRGTLDYRVRGSVRVTDPIGRTVPYRHEGTVTMSGFR
jgi:LEA14-like dessication related protein